MNQGRIYDFKTQAFFSENKFHIHHYIRIYRGKHSETSACVLRKGNNPRNLEYENMYIKTFGRYLAKKKYIVGNWISYYFLVIQRVDIFPLRPCIPHREFYFINKLFTKQSTETKLSLKNTQLIICKIGLLYH